MKNLAQISIGGALLIGGVTIYAIKGLKDTEDKRRIDDLYSKYKNEPEFNRAVSLSGELKKFGVRDLALLQIAFEVRDRDRFGSFFRAIEQGTDVLKKLSEVKGAKWASNWDSFSRKNNGVSEDVELPRLLSFQGQASIVSQMRDFKSVAPYYYSAPFSDNPMGSVAVSRVQPIDAKFKKYVNYDNKIVKVDLWYLVESQGQQFWMPWQSLKSL